MTIHLPPGLGVRPPAPGHEPHYREPHRPEPFPCGFGPLPAPADHDAPTEAAA